MTAALTFALAALVVVACARLTEGQSSSNFTEEQGDGYVVVLFKSAENEKPLMSSKDLAALITELQSEEIRKSGPYFTLSECLRQRESGVESCLATTPCLNLKLFATNHNEKPSDVFNSYDRGCSLLVYWLQDMKNDNETSENNQKPSVGEVWGYGILTTSIISLSGISGIFCYPVMKRGYFKEVMNVLMGLACGSLSATAFFQLIPETFNMKMHHENYLSKALLCWCSMWIFYLVGVTTSIAAEQNKQNQKRGVGNSRKDKPCSSIEPQNALEMAVNPGVINTEEEKKQFIDTVEDNTTQTEEYQKNPAKLATAAMVMFGDSLHNFVDGMSIGAGYTQSLVTGLSISAGIACEEFPHELGDFAVLIKYGYPFKKALKLNYASASTIFLGLIVGILVGQIEASTYIYAISAGLFLYISLGELIPELKDMVKEMQANGIKSAIIAFSLQNVGMLTGAMVLYLVAKYIDGG